MAQWDPRPAVDGGQRVALFYVQGFNFGLKSAVMAYNAVAEFQTRAAVRLLPIVACHYFDDLDEQKRQDGEGESGNELVVEAEPLADNALGGDDRKRLNGEPADHVDGPDEQCRPTHLPVC